MEVFKPEGGSLFKSKAFKVGANLAMGNPAGAAAALTDGSPMGRALSLYQTGSDIASKLTPDSSGGGGKFGLMGRDESVGVGNTPGLMGRADNALQRRFSLTNKPIGGL